MSCLGVDIRLLRSRLSVVVSGVRAACVRLCRLGGCRVSVTPLERGVVEVTPIRSKASVNVGLLCSVGVGKWEYLACSDLGWIRTLDKGYIIVPKS